MQRLRKLAALPRHDRRLLLEALVLTGVARLAILLFPFRWIAMWMGELGRETSRPPKKQLEETVDRVKWAVATVSRHVPWQAKCFVQVVTARSMLGRRGVEGTIYFGLAKDARGDLCAHAWLRCGGRIVTGGRGCHGFAVVSTFAFDTKVLRSG